MIYLEIAIAAVYFGVAALFVLAAAGKLPTKARARHRARMARWAVEREANLAHQEEVRRKLDEALAEFRTKVAEWDPAIVQEINRYADPAGFEAHADEALELANDAHTCDPECGDNPMCQCGCDDGDPNTRCHTCGAAIEHGKCWPYPESESFDAVLLEFDRNRAKPETSA